MVDECSALSMACLERVSHVAVGLRCSFDLAGWDGCATHHLAVLPHQGSAIMLFDNNAWSGPPTCAEARWSTPLQAHVQGQADRCSQLFRTPLKRLLLGCMILAYSVLLIIDEQ